MPLAFTPKTEAQILAEQLAPAGDYDFEILSAEDQTSKSGNPMIKLKLGVYNGDAMRWQIYDYLVGAMEAKLRHFADTCGLLAVYESGRLSAQECTGRAGKVRLVVKEGDGKYPAKNEVKDYILRPVKPLPGPKAEAPGDNTQGEPVQDDVPF